MKLRSKTSSPRAPSRRIRIIARGPPSPHHRCRRGRLGAAPPRSAVRRRGMLPERRFRHPRTSPRFRSTLRGRPAAASKLPAGSPAEPDARRIRRRRDQLPVRSPDATSRAKVQTSDRLQSGRLDHLSVLVRVRAHELGDEPNEIRRRLSATSDRSAGIQCQRGLRLLLRFPFSAIANTNPLIKPSDASSLQIRPSLRARRSDGPRRQNVGESDRSQEIALRRDGRP